MEAELKYEDGKWLPKWHGSLAAGVPRAIPGAVHALAVAGGYSVGPGEGRIVYFGRNSPEVHVCVGEDDQQVSRRQGELTYSEGHWWLRNTGRRPIRLPSSQWLFAGEPAVPLADGYTPLLVPGSREREHLLQVYVTEKALQGNETVLPQVHQLTADERLILVALGQRYLKRGVNPQPATWQQAAELLARLQPDADWTAKKIEHRVGLVRHRLSRDGVRDMTGEEVGEPAGTSLNDNLLKELVRSTTLGPPDLALLEGDQ